MVIDFLNPSSSSFCTVSSSFCYPGRRLFQWRFSTGRQKISIVGTWCELAACFHGPIPSSLRQQKKVGKESEPDVDNFRHYNAQNQEQDHVTLHSVNIQFLPLQSGLITAWHPSYLLFLHMLKQSHQTLIGHKWQLCLPRHRHQLLPHIPKLMARVWS